MTEAELVQKYNNDIFSAMPAAPKLDLAKINYTATPLPTLDSNFITSLQEARQKAVETNRNLPDWQRVPMAEGESLGLGGLSDKIIKYAEEYGATDEQTAYMLATARHESNFKNIAEKNNGSDAYYSAYIGKLGNESLQDAVKYKGRGVVQLTGKSNYEKFGRLLGIDLVNNPDLILQDDDLAAKILVKGSLDGSFTGSKLGDHKSYRDMRKVVNGDIELNGDKIAGYATEYEKLLKNKKANTVQGNSGYNYEGVIALKNSSGLWTDGTPFDVSGIDFVGSVSGGRISSGQEWRKQAGRGQFNLDPKTGLQMNTGLDIAAPVGSAIKMPSGFQTAEVISAGATASSSGYGNQFIVKMTNKNGQVGYWQGSHLQNISVKVGDKLSAGQQIATVGRTGNVTGPHLDSAFYTINPEGKKVYQKITGGKPQQAPIS